MKLLVPLDGSAASRHALDHALWLTAQIVDAEVILLNVQNDSALDLSELATGTGRERELALRYARPILSAGARRCREAGIRHEKRAEYGSAAEMIEHVARTARVDLIVMGTRGLGRFGGLLMGSVATEVVRRVRVPVTLVKQTARRIRTAVKPQAE